MHMSIDMDDVESIDICFYESDGTDSRDGYESAVRAGCNSGEPTSATAAGAAGLPLSQYAPVVSID